MREVNPLSANTARSGSWSMVRVLLVASLMASAGCAASGRLATSSERERAEEEPPPSATAPASQGLYSSELEKRRNLDAWSRNLRWHSQKMGLSASAAYERPGPRKDRAASKPRPARPARPASPEADEPARRKEADVAQKSRRRHEAVRCRKACRHTKAICKAAERICRLADDLNEAAAHQRCSWARSQCLRARRLTDERCGGCD
jgi:hypothetical protein